VGRQEENDEEHPEGDEQTQHEHLEPPRRQVDDARDHRDGEREQGQQRAPHLLGQEPLELEGVARVPADPELVSLDAADQVAKGARSGQAPAWPSRAH